MGCDNIFDAWDKEQEMAFNTRVKNILIENEELTDIQFLAKMVALSLTTTISHDSAAVAIKKRFRLFPHNRGI